MLFVELAYPLNSLMPDGMTVSVYNKDEMNTAFKTWYEINVESKEKPILVYPLDVVLKNGSTITINNEQEMIDLKKKCK